MLRYHDEEWGVPVHDDQILFEFLILEGVQAGLSWQTVLRKRENYRKAFRHFDPEAVAQFTEAEIERLPLLSGMPGNSWRSGMSTALSIPTSGSFLGADRSIMRSDRWEIFRQPRRNRML